MKNMFLWSISKFFSVIYLLIFIRIVLSWVRINKYSKYFEIIFQLTDIILEPVRKLIGRLGIDTGMLDLSPIIAYFLLQFIENSIKKIIWVLL